MIRLGVVFGLLAFFWVSPSLAEDGSQSDVLPPELIRSEFEALYTTLRESHYDLYVNRPQAAYDQRFQEMLASLDRPMSLPAVQQTFQRFVAYGDVAHAKIDPPVGAWEQFRSTGGKAFPVFFRVIDDRVFVDDVMADVGLALGSEVIAIDGVAALEWMTRLRAHVSADSDYLAFTMMENLLPILVWMEWGAPDAYRLELHQEDGNSVVVSVPGLSRDDLDSMPSLADPRFVLDWDAREARMIDKGVAYLRPGPFYDNRAESTHPWDPSAFHAFIDEAFGDFIAAGAQHLLIDLRNNPGGSNSFSDYMIAWFADKPFRFSDRFEIRVSEAAIASNQARLEEQSAGEDEFSASLAEAYSPHTPGDVLDYPIEWVAPREGLKYQGAVYILTNRHTYSNAVSVAAIGQDYGFAKVMGEPTADLVNTYGGMEHFTLPKTGIRVGFPKARILRPSRDETADTVIPDTLIQAPRQATHDVVFERALQLVQN